MTRIDPSVRMYSPLAGTRTGRSRLELTAVAAMLCISLGARPASAQEAFGTLREATSQRPVVGALITVSLAANDSTIARTITSERGTFVVRVGASPVVVRALRIGQQPVELARFALAVGERRELSAELPDRPVQIMAIGTRVDSRCRNDPVDGSRVAQLFNDARTALWASRVAAANQPATAVFRQVVQRYNMRDRPVGKPEVREDTLRTLQPFRANDVSQLLEAGFLAVQLDNSLIFSAPDAELLTDDRFLSQYCLRLASDKTDDPTLIGVTFEPARARAGVVQVRGTLWLDRRTQELRRIEYGYRGLDASQARVAPGGVVEYTRLDTGVWFVSDWSIRMPTVASLVRRAAGRSFAYTSVTGVQITSGHVASIHNAGDLLFTSGEESVLGGSDALVESIVSLRDSTYCDLASEDTLVTLQGELHDESGAPVAGELVRVRWTELRRTGEVGAQDTHYVEHERQLFATAGPDGTFELCDLPRGVKIELIAGPTDRPMARTTVRLRRDAHEVRVELTAR